MPVSNAVKKVIIPLGILSFFVAMVFGLYQPEFKKISKYRSQPVAARKQIENMMQTYSGFIAPSPEERSEWLIIESELKRRIPTGRQITELYAYLSSLAEKCELTNFQRQEIPDSDSSFEDGGIKRNGFDLEITFSCEYPSLVKFLNGLQEMERLVEVVNLEVTRGLPQIEVKVILRSYYFP